MFNLLIYYGCKCSIFYSQQSIAQTFYLLNILLSYSPLGLHVYVFFKDLLAQNSFNLILLKNNIFINLILTILKIFILCSLNMFKLNILAI